MYAENETFKWYSGYEMLDVTVNNVLTAAFYDWKQSNANILVSGEEERKNSDSKTRRFDLVKSKIKVCELTMQNRVGKALFSTGTDVAASDNKIIGGLPILISDTPGVAGDVIGDIDAAENVWWRNQVLTLSDIGKTTMTPADLLQLMDLMFMNCTRSQDIPTVIIMDKKYYNLYKQACITQKRITHGSSTSADGGFRTLEFEGIPVYWDINCPENHAYFLNENYLFFKVHPDANFKLDKSKAPYNQDAKVFPMLFMGNLTCSNRNLQGVIWNGTQTSTKSKS